MSDKGHSDGESDIDDHSSSDSESNIDDDGSSDGETDIDDDETKRIMDEIDDELGYSIDVYKRARLYIPLNQTPRTWLPNVGHKFSRHNDDLYSWAPPKELNIERLLRSYQLSIEELITFLPLHSTWTPFWHRCAKGEWGQTDVAKLMVASRRLPNEDKAGMRRRYNALSNRCHYSKRVAMGAEARAAVPACDGEPACAAKPARDAVPPRKHLLQTGDSVNDSVIDFTTSNWMHPCKDSNLVADCPLLRLAHKVTHMPRGNGKGILTIAVENAKVKNHWSVMLSELAIYVAQEGLNVPEFRLLTSSGTLSDVAATDRAARDAFRITYRNLT